jgi:dolichol-phosphate mannosyltransferase
MPKTISIVIPVYNEEKNVPLIVEALLNTFKQLPDFKFELIFVNDGSTDGTQKAIDKVVEAYPHTVSLEFSRNFGKEAATTAGIAAATGDALIMIDADLQHPVELIPRFLEKWQEGLDMVIGVRTKNPDANLLYRLCSRAYYNIMNCIAETSMVPGETDFRLIDRKVIDAFGLFTERERVTRILLNWMGFKRAYVEFEANKRANGEAGYYPLKLFRLGISSFVSHSLFPLKLAGYIGVIIAVLSGIFGVAIFVEQYIFNDPFDWYITGSAKLAILNVFLVGVVLMCLGLIALYIGAIHNETSGRPLYIIRKKK